MSYDWAPQNWKEWAGLFLIILFVGAALVPTLVTSEMTVWLGLALFLFITVAVTTAVIITVFGLSRWVFRKLRTRFAVERLPRMPKEP